MLRTQLRIAAMLAGCFLVSSLCYVATQEPRVWLHREWFGLALTKGGYRWWAIRFHDGKDIVEGKLQTVTTENGKVEPGHYWIPRYEHCDARGSVVSEE